MKFAVVAAVCLSLVVCALANNVSVGQRQDGDVLVASRRLIRPAIPGKPMIAKTGFHAHGLITAVSAVNAPGSDATVAIIVGGPGHWEVVVEAVSQPGAALDVQVDIYAALIPDREDEQASP